MLVHIENLPISLIPESNAFNLENAISTFAKGEVIEYLSDHSPLFIEPVNNQYIAGLTAAFECHYNFELNPNDIWLIIIQNLAIHINQNSEKFRDVMVSFEDKKTLTIIHNALVKGDSNNDWSILFPKFAEAIKQNLKNPVIAEKIVTHFSNSEAIDITNFSIALMDICQSYFDYRVFTRCGIPNIDIVGTKEDWQEIVNNISYLLPIFELDGWLSRLTPVLNKIIATFDGDIDVSFFRSMYKYNSMSGGAFTTGWINEFFIYTDKVGKIEMITNNSMISTSSFISSISRVPFIWDYYGTIYKMNFYSGIVGFDVDNANSIIRMKKSFAITYQK